MDAGTDPITGRRRRLNRTVHVRNNKRGEQQADTELAKIVVEVGNQRAPPSSSLTIQQLIERYVASRTAKRAPGAADETTRRVEQHIAPTGLFRRSRKRA